MAAEVGGFVALQAGETAAEVRIRCGMGWGVVVRCNLGASQERLA